MIEDEFSDDLSVPNETVIYYSKISTYFEIIVGILIISFGIYSYFTKNYFGSIIFIPFGIYMIYKERKKVRNKNPQIIINNNGIEIHSKKFSKWSTIKNIEIVCEEGADTKEYFLSFNSHKGRHI
jgi:putative Mn2+ efflux pump MntP